ncbi:MAG: hypothetical protein WBN94_04225 [Methanothrix sp.]
MSQNDTNLASAINLADRVEPNATVLQPAQDLAPSPAISARPDSCQPSAAAQAGILAGPAASSQRATLTSETATSAAVKLARPSWRACAPAIQLDRIPASRQAAPRA